MPSNERERGHSCRFARIVPCKDTRSSSFPFLALCVFSSSFGVFISCLRFRGDVTRRWRFSTDIDSGTCVKGNTPSPPPIEITMMSDFPGDCWMRQPRIFRLREPPPRRVPLFLSREPLFLRAPRAGVGRGVDTRKQPFITYTAWYRRRSDSGIIYRVFLQRRGAASRRFRAHEMNSSLSRTPPPSTAS